VFTLSTINICVYLPRSRTCAIPPWKAVSPQSRGFKPGGMGGDFPGALRCNTVIPEGCWKLAGGKAARPPPPVAVPQISSAPAGRRMRLPLRSAPAPSAKLDTRLDWKRFSRFLLCWELRCHPQSPLPEAWPLDTFTRFAGFNASRPFRRTERKVF